MESGWRTPVGDGNCGSRGPSLDGLRGKRAKGLELRVAQPEARRGEEVEVTLAIALAVPEGELEVGLVCTAHHDEEVHSSDSSSRVTKRDTAYEAWQPVPSMAGEHGVRVAIPPDAPYSHVGTCLSFTWEAVARARRARALDARAGRDITVLP